MANKPTNPKAAGKTGPKAAGNRATKPKLMQDGVPALSVVGEDGAEATAAKAGTGLRMKELVDRVVAATGGKKKGVKEIVEATLLQMGEALKKGESLNLPAFGRVRVARQGAEGGGAMTLKLRQGGPSGGGAGGKAKEALAEAEDQD